MLMRLVALVLALTLTACSGLPSQEGRTLSRSLLMQEGANTRLGRALQPLVAQHPARSGVSTLNDARNAFAARMLFIAAAERTIDIQYYIWRDDITGNLMLHALQQAAKRQVRVRLLLDDNGVAGLDSKLAALNAHPNIEVRLFNPFTQRRFKPLGFVTDFRRLNRRMHNKSLTVDGQATIVGGRNIGDEYFEATQGVAFSDLDVLVAGEVVDDVSLDFDRYWNSASAYPIENLVSTPDDSRVRHITQGFDLSGDPHARAYVEAITSSRYVEDLLAGRLEFEWAPVKMVSDDPAKVLNKAPHETLLWNRMWAVLEQPTHSVDLVSPYFVPTDHGVALFSRLAKQDVKVRILTNAMEATDVAAVHAGYAKYRKPLLEQGIALYEMRSQKRPDAPKEKAGPFGSSGSSLHAKTFAIDGKRVFVGSFNFDPRSAMLNTELGFVIHSERMAQQVADAFENNIPGIAYQLSLNAHEQLIWTDRSGTTPQQHTNEPGTTALKRLLVRVLSWLPIEPLL